MNYGTMASVYDRLMLHVDYCKWVDGLEYCWRQIESLPRTVLDAGCGTGNVLLPLVQRKYQVYGIDNSSDMLALCQNKLIQDNLFARLMEMDIRQIKLPDKIDAAICLCDTLNYFTEERDLERCFREAVLFLTCGPPIIIKMFLLIING